MNRIELLMPAGDLDKLKVALLYGADAVFIGGKKFSLRAKASNFTLEDIEEGVKFAHSLSKKVYVTVNIIPHYDDLDQIETYLLQLDKIGVDAIIVSSIYIIALCKKMNLNLQCHVSTQVSATNSSYLDFYKSLGCSRVVLARECSLKDISSIHENNDLELEVFVQGGLCSSISGKCTLSNYFVDRDANRGGCAHSCRWDYTLYDNESEINCHKEFKIASKDLMGIALLDKIIESGVSSLKVEGRMKSINYIALVARTYRKAIDAYYNGNFSQKLIDEVTRDLKKIENRPLCEGFLNLLGISKNDQIYSNESLMVNQKFLGYVVNYDKISKIAEIKRKNDIVKNKEIHVITYDNNDFSFTIDVLQNEKGNIEIANKTEDRVFIKSEKTLKKYYLLRGD